MKRCIPIPVEVTEIAKMLGLDKRPVYKWFWKRNKKDKEPSQPEAGTGGAIIPEDDAAEESESTKNNAAALLDKKRIFYKDFDVNWGNDFEDLSHELGFNVGRAAAELIDLPSPKQSRIVFTLNTIPQERKE